MIERERKAHSKIAKRRAKLSNLLRTISCKLVQNAGAPSESTDKAVAPPPKPSELPPTTIHDLPNGSLRFGVRVRMPVTV